MRIFFRLSCFNNELADAQWQKDPNAIHARHVSLLSTLARAKHRPHGLILPLPYSWALYANHSIACTLAYCYAVASQ